MLSTLLSLALGCSPGEAPPDCEPISCDSANDDSAVEDSDEPNPDIVQEARGLWLWPEWGNDPHEGPAAIEQEVSRLLEIGFNLFIPLVENHSAYYPSEQVSLYEGWDAYDYPRAFIDAVQTHDSEGRAEVHLWTAVFHQSDLLEEHPEFATVHQDGTPDSGMACPTHPEVRQRALAVVEELWDRYPEGVVHLDYVRHPEDGCYCETCRAAYEGEYGEDPHELDPMDETWVAWRAERVTTFVREVRTAAQTRDPEPRISAAVFAVPGPTEALSLVSQDWRAWLDEGLIDLAMPMLYSDKHSDFVSSCQACLGAVPPDHHQYVGIGLWTFAEQDQPEEALTQIELARALGAEGHVLFRAAYLDDDTAVLLEELYAQPAVLPHREDHEPAMMVLP